MQAKVLQHRLGTRRLAEIERDAGAGAVAAVAEAAGGPRGSDGAELLQELGRNELQRLAVARLATSYYSVTHALLATLPHGAAVTTNSDLCYDAACAAAGIGLNVLPYDTRPSQRCAARRHQRSIMTSAWLHQRIIIRRESSPRDFIRWVLKLHGDVHHPEDIVLTYSSATPYGAEKQALGGIVQARADLTRCAHGEISTSRPHLGGISAGDAHHEVHALRRILTARRGVQPSRRRRPPRART